MENLKNRSDFYKSLTPFIATSVAEGVCGGEDATEQEQRDAWQYLHDTGLAYQLQGFYGRTAKALIEAGEIDQF